MKTRPKDIGTAAETAVLKVVRPYWPGDGSTDSGARREVLHGHRDVGDIVGCNGVMFEVKGGHAAEHASDGQVVLWLRETERERENGGHRFGVLVAKRAGIGAANAGSWWAIMEASNFASLIGSPGHLLSEWDKPLPIRMPLWALLSIMDDVGLTCRK